MSRALGCPSRRGLTSCQVRREAWSTMFVICGPVDIGTLMSRNGVSAVTSPEASRAAPMIAAAPNRLLPRAALVVADAAQLIAFSGPVNPDSVGCPVLSAVGAVKALARPGFAQKKVKADDLPSRIK